MLRHGLDSVRTTLGSRVALAMVVASLGTLTAGTGTAIADAPDPGASPQGVTAHSHERNSSAVSVNTTDQSLVFNLTFAILKVTGNIVENQNVAAAYASCTACQTVAISIQTLLVESAASTVAPINEASARNQNCVQCDTLAIAYQFVVAAGTKLEFTPEGRREIAYIRRQLEALRQDARRGMTGAQIATAVTAIMQQYTSVLSNDLVPAAEHGAGGHGGTAGAAPSTAATSSTGSSQPVQTQTSPSATTSPTISTSTGTTPAATPPVSSATTPTPTSTPTDTGTAPTTTGTTTTSAGPTVTSTTSSATTTAPGTTSTSGTTTSGTTTSGTTTSGTTTSGTTTSGTTTSTTTP